MTSVRSTMLARRSMSKVTDQAPTHAELLELVAAAGRVADHGSLKPWRLIELRGDDREKLGRALAKAAGDDRPSTKPLRAPLLIAVVASRSKKSSVPDWEQDTVAAGVAHALSLVLFEEGWGVFWRTGSLTRAKAVAKMHGLGKRERLLGWLYVGGMPPRKASSHMKTIDASRFLSTAP